MQNLINRLSYKKAVIHNVQNDIDVKVLIEEVFEIENIFQRFKMSLHDGLKIKSESGETLIKYYGPKITEKTEFFNNKPRNEDLKDQPFLIASIRNYVEFDQLRNYVAKIYAVPNKHYDDEEECTRTQYLLPVDQMLISSYIFQIEGNPIIHASYIANLIKCCIKWNFTVNCTMFKA